MINKKIDNNTGFSLIELLIAIFFISIVLVAIASGMVKVAMALWETKARAIAVNMAQNCIEDINFANKYVSWYDFYGDPINGSEVIGRSCLGAAGLSDASSDGGFYDGFDPRDDEFIRDQNPINTANPEAGGVVSSDKPMTLKRTFTDESIETRFDFQIEIHRAIRDYRRNVAGLFSQVNSQAVIVIMDVSWQKYNSSGSARNTYTVTKQYLQPTTY
ncbi:hypothetical protein FWH30_02815 [Microgenomates group bacterium]|nr:hypothetical protein [Microgenomates group bacterium]